MAQVFKDIGQPITLLISCSLPLNYKNLVVAWDNLPTIAQTIKGLTTQLFK
jgi:hypothetical protein